MSSTEKFELNDLISVLSGSTVVNSTDERRRTLVTHVVGAAAVKKDYVAALEKARQHIEDSCPKIVQVAKNVANVILDLPRYNKLIDLYGKYHLVTSTKKPVKKKQPELETA